MIRNLKQAIDDVVDYNWEQEQRDWETSDDADGFYPDSEPSANCDHIFSRLTYIDKFLSRPVLVNRKSVTVGKLLENISDADLAEIIARSQEMV